MPFVQVIDVTKNLSLAEKTKQRISKIAQPKSVFVEKGSVVVTLQGSIGRVALLQYDAYIDRTLLIFKEYTSKTNTHFWAYLIQRKFDEEKQRAPGGTIKTITKEALSEFRIVIPEFREQTKIGGYFWELDRLIGLHQRKHDKLVTLKKAMLQKMFPQPGATTPEIRFKGFERDWDSIEMEKIGQPYSGLFGKAKDDFGRGEGRFVTYMGVFNHAVSNLNMTDAIGVDPSQNGVRKGDIFFTISSETPHEVGMSSVWEEDAENVYLNSFCFGFRPIPSLHSNFLAYVFRADEFRRRICILAQGISRYNISKTKVMKIPISIPSPEEQQKIGTYFRTLDELITQHATQLQKLQQVKAACLEKMFV